MSAEQLLPVGIFAKLTLLAQTRRPRRNDLSLALLDVDAALKLLSPPGILSAEAGRDAQKPHTVHAEAVCLAVRAVDALVLRRRRSTLPVRVADSGPLGSRWLVWWRTARADAGRVDCCQRTCGSRIVVSPCKTALLALKLGQSDMFLEHLPAVTRRRRKALGSPPPPSRSWTLVVEAGKELVAVGEVVARFPTGLRMTVPFDEVGELLSARAGLQKRLNLPLDGSVAAIVETQGIQ